MSKPQVTILMPIYNGGAFVAHAICDVLKQTFTSFELLIIDDGSTDDSMARVERFSDSRIRVLRNERNLGLVYTLNRGLEESSSEWIARCDADDRWRRDKLALQMVLAQRDPRLALIGSDAILTDAKGAFRGRFRASAQHELIAWDLCFRNAFVHSSVLFRRDIAADEFSGYREIPAAEDYDLWSRMAQKYRVANIRAPLLRYRLHPGSIMGQENAAGRSASLRPLHEIMEGNLRAFAGFSGALSSLLAQLDTWLEPAQNLPAFWEAYSQVWQDYRQQHRKLSLSVVGEHALNMFYRQRRLSRSEALRLLRALNVEQLRALPWPTVALQLAAP